MLTFIPSAALVFQTFLQNDLNRTQFLSCWMSVAGAGDQMRINATEQLKFIFERIKNPAPSQIQEHPIHQVDPVDAASNSAVPIDAAVQGSGSVLMDLNL